MQAGLPVDKRGDGERESTMGTKQIGRRSGGLQVCS